MAGVDAHPTLGEWESLSVGVKDWCWRGNIRRTCSEWEDWCWAEGLGSGYCPQSRNPLVNIFVHYYNIRPPEWLLLLVFLAHQLKWATHSLTHSLSVYGQLVAHSWQPTNSLSPSCGCVIGSGSCLLGLSFIGVTRRFLGPSVSLWREGREIENTSGPLIGLGGPLERPKTPRDNEINFQFHHQAMTWTRSGRSSARRRRNSAWQWPR